MARAQSLKSPTPGTSARDAHWRWLLVSAAIGAALPLAWNWREWHAQQVRTEAARAILVVPASASQAIDRLRQDLNEAVGWKAVLQSLKPGPDAALRLLGQVATTLPDGVVLRRLQWRDGIWIAEGRARNMDAVRAWIRAVEAAGGAEALAPVRCAPRLLAASAQPDGSRAFSVAGGCNDPTKRPAPQESAASAPDPEFAPEAASGPVATALAAVLALGAAGWWRTRPGVRPWRVQALRRWMRHRPFAVWPSIAVGIVAVEAALGSALLAVAAAPWQASIDALSNEELDLKHRFTQALRMPADRLPAVDRRWLAAGDGDPTDAFERSTTAAVSSGALASARVQRGPWLDREYHRVASHRIEIMGGFDAIGTSLERALNDPAQRLALVAFELAPGTGETLRLDATLRAVRAPAAR